MTAKRNVSVKRKRKTSLQSATAKPSSGKRKQPRKRPGRGKGPPATKPEPVGVVQPLRSIAAAKIMAAPYNPRAIKVTARDGLAASMDRWGVVQPPIWNERTGHIVGGNQKVAILLADGATSIDCVVVNLPLAEEKALNVALNDPNMAGTFTSALDDLIAEIRAEIDDLPDTLNFDSLVALALDDDAEKAEAPPLAATPVSRLGDRWTLGDHVVTCGDSCERATYTRLLGADRLPLVVTDPPYGVAYQDANRNRIKGDLTQSAFPVAMSCIREVLDTNARLYVFCAADQISMADRVFSHEFAMRPKLLIWSKDSFILRHNGYHSQFEMVLFAWLGTGGAPKHWHGDRKQSDVWQVSHDPEAERVHPTQKPVEVCAIPIRNSSAPGDLVLDPFLGSGSTLIACESLGRKCRAIELDPLYCDVSIRRWQKMTSRAAVLHDGRKFSQVEKKR